MPHVAPKPRRAAGALTQTVRAGAIAVAAVVLLLGLMAGAALSSGGSYRDAVLSDNPVGYWRLAESSGTTIVDELGAGHGGSYSGTVALGQAGPITTDGSDGAAYFNGGWGSIPYYSGLNPTTNKLSLEFWWKGSAPNAARFMVMKGYTSHSDPYYQYGVGDDTTGKVRVVVDTSGTFSPWDTGVAWPSDGAWHQIVLTYDGSLGSNNLKLYIDAVQRAQTSKTGNVRSYSSALGLMDILNLGSGYQTTGRLDEVSVYNSALSSSRVSAHYTAATIAPPSNTTLPSISGTAIQGQTLSTDNGSWTGNPTSYAYQWRRCDSGGANCSDVSEATSSTYTLASADIGSKIRAEVTATNAVGSTVATSPASDQVEAPVAPTLTAAPAISGTLEEGKTLTASSGTWSGSQPMSISYQWQQCVGGTCVDIPGATTNTHVATADDVGAILRVNVQASNVAGSTGGNHETSTVASPPPTLSPYRDPDYADELWTLLLAHWPNIFSPAEQALGNSVTDKHIKTGLWKARTAAAILPPLGWAPLTWKPDETWGLGWKITRSLGDVKWVHLTGDPGFSNFAPNPETNYVDGVRWEHWCDTPDHPACPGGYYGGIDHPQWVMDFHRAGYAGPPNGGWHIARFPDMTGVQDSSCYYLYMDYICDWGTSPEDLAWNHHLWDFNTQTTIAGTLTPFAAANGLCGISRNPVPCFTRSLSDADMASRIQVDDFGSYSNQAVDLVWPADNSPLYPWNVPAQNLDAPRAVLENEREARDWVNRQLTLKPSLKDPPQVFGLANQGETLIGTQGDWNYATSYSAHWLRCNASGGGCTDLYAATSYAHPLTAVDVGSTMRFKITAWNASGSATAISDPSPLVLSPISQLVLNYRPTLLFDSGEHYRPISVDSLLAERDANGQPVHKHCDVVNEPIASCFLVGSISELVAPPTNPQTIRSFLSLWSPVGDPNDDQPYGGSPSDYRSPTCSSTAFFRDCGDTSAIYYDYGQSAHGYRFLDYWFFYRFNPVDWDNHEGDWEGLTVQLDSRPDLNAPINGIILAQHNKLIFRLAYAFEWCPDGATSQASCSFGAPPAGSATAHAATFIAEGSHASYDDACTQECPNPAFGGEWEHSHDGAVGWSYNDDAACQAVACLRTFSNEWNMWNGSWGGSIGNAAEDVLGTGHSPPSPGVRANSRYGCTQVGWACSTVPDGSIMPLSTRRRQARNQARDEVRFEKRCSTWLDAGLAAGACSGTELRKTILGHRLANKGRFTLIVRGHRTATAPGLAQVVGPLLRAGAKVHFRGSLGRDELVILNVVVKHRQYQFRLTSLRLRRGAVAAVSLGAAGQPKVKLQKMKARVTIKTVSK